MRVKACGRLPSMRTCLDQRHEGGESPGDAQQTYILNGPYGMRPPSVRRACRILEFSRTIHCLILTARI